MNDILKADGLAHVAGTGDTTIDALIARLRRLRREHGGDTTVKLGCMTAWGWRKSQIYLGVPRRRGAWQGVRDAQAPSAA